MDGKSLVPQIADLEKKLEQLENTEEEDLTEEDHDNYHQLESELQELASEREEYRMFTDEQKAKSGVLIHLDYNDGAPQYRMGIVVKEEKESDADSEPSNGADADSDAKRPEESQALRTDLANYHLQAFQAELMQNPELCFDLTVFSMAYPEFSHYGYYKPLDISLQTSQFETKDIGQTRVATKIEETRESLNLEWATKDTPREKFEAFQGELSQAEKMAIMAYCAARTTKGMQTPIVPVAAEQMSFNLADLWQPTKANYFNRVKKPVLLEILTELKGTEYAGQQSNAKKGDLAAHLEDLAEVKAGWLPASMNAAA